MEEMAAKKTKKKKQAGTLAAHAATSTRAMTSAKIGKQTATCYGYTRVRVGKTAELTHVLRAARVSALSLAASR
jgi:hypothetical protein